MSRSSKIRASYQKKFILRLILFFIMLTIYLWDPGEFNLLYSGNFFQSISVLHIFWGFWMWDMFHQILPSNKISMGSKKQFNKFTKVGVPQTEEKLKQFRKEKDKEALHVLVPWIFLTACIGVFRTVGILGKPELFLICGLFYIGDIVCVLFWCPFSDFFMGNRCCCTCRIYNWDHFMMFTPFLFCLDSFYTISLVLTATFILISWEYRYQKYPNRFWEKTNTNLQCTQCEEKLCRKRFQKIRGLDKEKNL